MADFGSPAEDWHCGMEPVFLLHCLTASLASTVDPTLCLCGTARGGITAWRDNQAIGCSEQVSAKPDHGVSRLIAQPPNVRKE